MHNMLLITGDILMIAAVASSFLYAPMANGWKRAVLIPFSLTFIWGLVRIVSIALFKEPSPPLMGFVVAPFIILICAIVVRGLKLLLCQLPFFRKVEESLRSILGINKH